MLSVLFALSVFLAFIFPAALILAIKGAGFISSKLLNSAMTLDFAYTLYLILLDTPEIPNVQIKRYVQKWFVLTTLTSRYIGSPESQMDRDMRSIQEKGFKNFLSEVEASGADEYIPAGPVPGPVYRPVRRTVRRPEGRARMHCGRTVYGGPSHMGRSLPTGPYYGRSAAGHVGADDSRPVAAAGPNHGRPVGP